jgi:hypothetical protein
VILVSASVFTARAASAQDPPTGSGTITLVCDARTLGGDKAKAYVFIDPARKHVRFEGTGMAFEFTDGAYGKSMVSGAAILGGKPVDVSQFVTIGSDEVVFGFKGPNGTSTIRIDRHSGMMTTNGRNPYWCEARKGF